MKWTLERIYAHCDDELDGCKLWRGAMAKRGSSRRYPVAQEPAPGRRRNQRQIHVRRKVWELAKGEPAPSGPRYVLVAKCGEERCVDEGCLVLMTKSKRLRLAVDAGAFKSVAFAAKVAKARRRTSRLTDEAVAAIKASSEPGHVLAQRYGISRGYASGIKAGTRRRDYSSPFAALQPAMQRRLP